jgi:Na+-driven multidrug efflux pump
VNFLILSAILLTGLTGLALVIPYYGVIFAIGAFAMMSMVQYQSSFYINREVDSAHRATVLSFRGLALNLGLGLASLFYTALVATLRGQATGELGNEALENKVFEQSLTAFPFYYLLLFVGLLLAGRLLVSNCSQFFRRPH